MVDITNIPEVVGSYLPGNFAGIAISTIAIGLFIVLFCIIAAIVAYTVIQRKKYRNTIVIFEKVDGRYKDTGKDKAMEIKIGDMGAYVLFMKKRKKYLPMPRIQSGHRKFYYAIREDGEWINIGIEDIDFKMKEAKVHYLDKEMRYAHAGIRKGLKDRYEETNFWKQYGMLVVSIIFVVIIAIMTWLLFDKWITLAQVTNEGVKTSGEVMALARDILANIDNVKSGGSGIIRVANST